MHFTFKISAKPLPGLRSKSISALLFLSLLVTEKPFAQVFEDFSDGDFTQNPSWSGTDTAFLINNDFQLQLNSGSAGTSWLQTSFPASQSQDIEWELFVKQSFAPSSANFGRFYLTGDQSNLSAPLNGYYLQFGEAGSTDAVELFRQSGATSVSVCRATSGRIAASFSLRVRVTRSHEGMWELYVDYAGGTNFVLEASGSDAEHPVGAYYGIRCTYTITNATRFYFDDISVRTTTAADTTPPKIVSVAPTSSQNLLIVFSEELDSATAENPLHYLITTLSIHPSSAVLMDNKKTVELLFNGAFRSGFEETIRVENVEDLAGNPIVGLDAKFLYFKGEPVNFRDIVITEILPDPVPAVRLPEAEFVEILNRSPHAIDLTGWSLSDEASSGQVGSFIILPGHYLILTASGNAAKFLPYGEVVTVSPFPFLNNSGDNIKLKQPDGHAIDSVRYHVSWYQDDEKADGGWSLELIDPANICAEKSNWVAASADSGGSPGGENSVFANKPDNRGPKIISVRAQDPGTLIIDFDEKLESSLPGITKFSTDPQLSITAVQFSDASLTSVRLSLGENLQPSKTYLITVEDVYDCPGNRIQAEFSQATFVLPEKAVTGDIVINEVLFNPRPTGVDFIEVFNRSEKSIDLRGWSLRNSAGSTKPIAFISGQNVLLYPKEYGVFTSNPQVLKGEYVMGSEETFKETELPALNDDAGGVTIIDQDGTVIDSIQYDEKRHAPFIRDPEGVSLERISIVDRSDGISNWRSASSVSGFATPGLVNSNLRPDIAIDDGAVVLDPEIIRRDVYSNDFTQIKYRFDRGGFMANVKIFDQQGRAIRDIAANELLGTEGFFRWDGDHNNGSLARVGYYVVWFEIFDSNGKVKTYKRRLAVY